MIEQNYNLNTIPSASPVPIVHVSQYDKGSRTLKFKLFEGSGEYSMASVNGAKINGKKPDGNWFSYNMTIAGNVVSVDVTEQMTAVAGRVVSEIVLTGANSSVLGTANFIIEVEESPMDEGVISETDLPILEQLVSDAQTAASEAQAAAEDASASASSAAGYAGAIEEVKSIVPASPGTAGQVLTKTATGADWQDVDGLPAGGTAVRQVISDDGYLYNEYYTVA